MTRPLIGHKSEKIIFNWHEKNQLALVGKHKERTICTNVQGSCGLGFHLWTLTLGSQKEFLHTLLFSYRTSRVWRSVLPQRERRVGGPLSAAGPLDPPLDFAQVVAAACKKSHRLIHEQTTWSTD